MVRPLALRTSTPWVCNAFRSGAGQPAYSGSGFAASDKETGLALFARVSTRYRPTDFATYDPPTSHRPPSTGTKSSTLIRLQTKCRSPSGAQVFGPGAGDCAATGCAAASSAPASISVNAGSAALTA